MQFVHLSQYYDEMLCSEQQDVVRLRLPFVRNAHMAGGLTMIEYYLTDQLLSSEKRLVSQLGLVQFSLLLHDERQITQIHALDALSQGYLKKKRPALNRAVAFTQQNYIRQTNMGLTLDEELAADRSEV